MKIIEVAARKSLLSQVQVEEVLAEIRKFEPSIVFKKFLIDTTGDLDLKTPLSKLDKTNFFTKEIDEALLKKNCRIAIHSAKDLPEHLENGLSIMAITKGLDKRDSLVLRENESLDSLKKGAFIGTSSKLRQQTILKLRTDFQIKDIRGTIESRIAQLNNQLYDGVVIAEAALIRLKLHALNRVILEGLTTPFQGQLAIIARDEDKEMRELFSAIDIR